MRDQPVLVIDSAPPKNRPTGTPVVDAGLFTSRACPVTATVPRPPSKCTVTSSMRTFTRCLPLEWASPMSPSIGRIASIKDKTGLLVNTNDDVVGPYQPPRPASTTASVSALGNPSSRDILFVESGFSGVSSSKAKAALTPPPTPAAPADPASALASLTQRDGAARPACTACPPANSNRHASCFLGLRAKSSLTVPFRAA